MPKGNPQSYRTGRDYPEKQPSATGGTAARSNFGRKVQPGITVVPQGEAQRGVGRDHPANRSVDEQMPNSDPFPGRK